jgi:hypothetical protein
MEAAARPFPNEDTTPPVTKMYLADISATSLDGLEVCAWCAQLSIAGLEDGSNGLTFLRRMGGKSRCGGIIAVDNVQPFAEGRARGLPSSW